MDRGSWGKSSGVSDPGYVDTNQIDGKKSAILGAAREMCNAIGIHQVKMADIATKAKVSKGTLYRFFQTKEDLFSEMILVAHRQDTEALEKILGGSIGAEGKIRQVLETYAQQRSCDRLQCEVAALGMAQKDAGTAELLKKALHVLFDRQRSVVENALREGIEACVFHAGTDIDVWVQIICGCGYGIAYRSALGNMLPTPEVSKRVIDLKLAALKNGGFGG